MAKVLELFIISELRQFLHFSWIILKYEGWKLNSKRANADINFPFWKLFIWDLSFLPRLDSSRLTSTLNSSGCHPVLCLCIPPALQWAAISSKSSHSGKVVSFAAMLKCCGGTEIVGNSERIEQKVHFLLICWWIWIMFSPIFVSSSSPLTAPDG